MCGEVQKSETTNEMASVLHFFLINLAIDTNENNNKRKFNKCH